MTKRVEIAQGQRVATMGSCFAQHLARHIQKIGLTYYVAEQPPKGMPQELARERNYGVFSARYGNVYTVRQAVQLFDRAYERFKPSDDAWRSGDGYVDAFRPRIDPVPAGSVIDIRRNATEHLGYVREVFERSHWLVLTLGLTEAWRSKLDGAVYPVAPGVAGGEFDEARYEFVNFSASETRQDIDGLISRIRSVNPGCMVILTVSPVPLIATYAARHVLVSTSYSKAVLRAVAGEAELAHENVVYFPSYEIITSPAAAGSYYADDLREVTELGVRHVMRVFEAHCLRGHHSTWPPPPSQVPSDRNTPQSVICDEEAIEAVLQESGISARATVARK